jgi:hypothetical protein
MESEPKPAEHEPEIEREQHGTGSAYEACGCKPGDPCTAHK